MRLLTLKIQEPLPGSVLVEMAKDHGPDEAARRYRAIALTTLRQLKNLSDTRIRLHVTPTDGHEAVRFWLLPKLATSWHHQAEVFHAAGWEIDFGGESHDFSVHAVGAILCPNLGARWVHTAMLGLATSEHSVIGLTESGGEYFRAHAPDQHANAVARMLPQLPVILTNDHWLEALESPLGPALKRAWEEEA